MAENRHQPYDLAQMQSLPLEVKIQMTKERIEAWYNSWCKFEIEDIKTGKTREVTIDCREFDAEPPMKETECIKSFYRGQVYVSFSGGKDSTVLKHIVDSMYDDVPALFVNTGLEYPEIQKFAMSQKNVITVRPEMRFDEVVKTYGYPIVSKEVSKRIVEYHNAEKKGNLENSLAYKEFNGLRNKNTGGSFFNKEKWNFLVDAPFGISPRCCDVMKKKPAKKYEKETGRKAIIGTMASESFARKKVWLQNGCNAFESVRPTSQPLSFWTEQDILEYIKKYNVPYCSAVYGDIIEENGKLKTTGRDRTGCLFCAFGISQDGKINRFQRLKETHPRQYEYCIGGGEMIDGKWQPSKEGLGLGYVLDYIGVKYE